MERKKFIQNFSRRLTTFMQQEGHGTSRSKAGIDIYQLAKISGCSYQMARKYAIGEALPELNIVLKIATWLNTSPSWLLFGDNDTKLPEHRSDVFIEIEPDLLKYIINKSMTLFSFTDNKEDICQFIVDTIYDASHLNTDKATVYKIIDMMVSSATLLSLNKEKRTNKVV